MNAARAPRVRLYWLLVVSALWAGCAESEPITSTPGPNVLLILVDSLRADHLAASGYGRDTAPFLDEFALRGTRFSQAYSHSSHTKLSVASLFSGLTPPNHGLRRAGEDGQKHADKLADAVQTLAESFSAAGYATAGFVTNPHLKDTQGFSQGFDEYFYSRWRKMPAEGLNREALSWIDGAESPFFVYLHYMDVHFPYDPPAPYRTLYSAERSDLTPLRLNGPGSFDVETIAYSTALYDAQINYWDDHFRQLMEELEKARRMDDTIVVIVADHGEEFGEHAGFGHGFTTYPEVLHVPLVVVYGDFVAKGVVRHDLVRLIDIAPTLRGLAGLEPGLAAAEGSDLFAASGVGQTERVLYSEASSGHGPRSVRTSKHQLIFNSDDESWEFYRLGDDPRALRNRYGVVSRADRELLAELEAALLQRMEPTERAVESESVELGDETIEELEGLGYLQ